MAAVPAGRLGAAHRMGQDRGWRGRVRVGDMVADPGAPGQILQGCTDDAHAGEAPPHRYTAVGLLVSFVKPLQAEHRRSDSPVRLRALRAHTLPGAGRGDRTVYVPHQDDFHTSGDARRQSGQPSRPRANQLAAGNRRTGRLLSGAGATQHSAFSNTGIGSVFGTDGLSPPAGQQASTVHKCKGVARRVWTTAVHRLRFHTVSNCSRLPEARSSPSHKPK